MNKPSKLSMPYFNGWHMITILSAVLALNYVTELNQTIVVLMFTGTALVLSFIARSDYLSNQ